MPSEYPRPRSVQDADMAIASNGDLAAAVTADALAIVFATHYRRSAIAGLLALGLAVYAGREMTIATVARAQAEMKG
jgi:hypothetical protein